MLDLKKVKLGQTRQLMQHSHLDHGYSAWCRASRLHTRPAPKRVPQMMKFPAFRSEIFTPLRKIRSPAPSSIPHRPAPGSASCHPPPSRFDIHQLAGLGQVIGLQIGEAGDRGDIPQVYPFARVRWVEVADLVDAVTIPKGETVRAWPAVQNIIAEATFKEVIP